MRHAPRRNKQGDNRQRNPSGRDGHSRTRRRIPVAPPSLPACSRRARAIPGPLRPGPVQGERQCRRRGPVGHGNEGPRPVRTEYLAHRAYTTSVELRVRDAAALSDGGRRRCDRGATSARRKQKGARRHRARLGLRGSGAARAEGARVQQAVRRLTALGTIVGENVAGARPAGSGRTDRPPARPATGAPRHAGGRSRRTPRRRSRSPLAAAQIERLERGRASTMRSTRYATVELRLSTAQPVGAGPTTATGRCTGSASRSAGSGSAPSTRSRSARRSLLLGAPRLARRARASAGAARSASAQLEP